MEELPLDIREEILVRSKAKDLFRYKSVCKSWGSLISSRRFVDSHLNCNLKKQADNNETGDTRIVLVGPSSIDAGCQIVGSSNGLVCVCFRRQYLVVNPSTHQLIELESLPQIIRYVSYIGFGYDSSMDDYKVLMRVKNTYTDEYRFLVLTLRSNVWRSVVGELNYDLMHKGVLCNGAIHILGSDRTNYDPIIVSFDLSKEVFKVTPTPIPLPACDIISGEYKLGTSKDRLCFFHGGLRTLSDQCDLWLMKNSNVQESESIWEQMLSPPLCYDPLRPPMMHCIPRQSLAGYIHIWMLEEDSGSPVFVGRVISPSGKDRGKDHHIWLSTFSKFSHKYDEHVFVESLVSPHGMINDSGKRTTKPTKLLQKIIRTMTCCVM